MQNYHKLGYIKLSEYDIDPDVDGVISTIYVKANKIAVIDCLGEENDPDPRLTRIYVSKDYELTYEVKETVAEIFEQLENIHPSLR